MVIYAAGFTIIKKVTPDFILPRGFVALRLIGATPLLWLSGLFIREKVERKDLLQLAILSLCGVVINQSLFIQGMSMTSAISGAIIMVTSPLLVLILGNIILKEKITKQRALGIAIGLGGAALLTIYGPHPPPQPGMPIGTDSPLGDFFIFLNALSWGTFLVLVKPMMKKYHTITILKWTFLFAIFIIVPLGFTQVRAIHTASFKPDTLFNILFVVVGVTFIAYILNTYALKALSSTTVSAYIYLQPVMAAAIALYCGEHLNWQEVVSAILIFTGVILASQNKKAVTSDKGQVASGAKE
jgi:drug/metabolite transporter (DMT)-like permease